MNTPRTLQTKRNRPRSGFRKLQAATRSSRKRKQRASTTASPEDLGEVPGVGVPLALVVILLLHVAAIAGIWIHDRWSSDADLEATKVPLKEKVQPERIPDLDFHMVSAGETAESIAAQYDVEVDALLNVNEGISDYDAGWKINLPVRRVELPTVVGEPAVAPPNESALAYAPTERPPLQTSNEEIVPSGTGGELLEVGGTEAEAGKTDEAVLIKPLTPLPGGRESSSAASTHVVTSGQTFWSISRDHGITVPELQRANPGVNPKSLGIGTKLVIPASR